MLRTNHEKNKTLALTWYDDSTDAKEREILNKIANAENIDYDYLGNLIENLRVAGELDSALIVQHFRSKAHF